MEPDAVLPSWNDTPTRAAIVDFVAASVDPDSDLFVPVPERVAVFDNDGTLWSEKPMPIQLDFTVFRMAQQVEGDPSLAVNQPYAAAVERDFHWLGAAMVKHYHGDDADLGLLSAAVSTRLRGHDDRGVRDAGRRVVRDGDAPGSEAPVPHAAASRRWSSCCAISSRTGSPPTSRRAATATSCARSPRRSTASRRSG